MEAGQAPVSTEFLSDRETTQEDIKQSKSKREVRLQNVKSALSRASTPAKERSHSARLSTASPKNVELNNKGRHRSARDEGHRKITSSPVESRKKHTPSPKPRNESRNKSATSSSTPPGFSQKIDKFLGYYQDALQRRLKQEEERKRKAFVKIQTPEPDSDDAESEHSEENSGAALWKRAFQKAALITKLKSSKREDSDRLHATSHATPRWRVIQSKRSVKETQKMLRRLEVLKKFRRKARIIIFCIRCVKEHCFKFRERSELTPYMTTLDRIDYRSGRVTDLMFDRSQFLADRKMRFPEEAKRILSLRKSERTENEIYSAQIVLRNIKHFADLPARMQRMLAQAGMYESFESKRVITREHHPATNYYFILSGAVVAMKLDPGQTTASAIAELVKGDAFEEACMLHDTSRQITVVTKEPCEFLSISAVDYKTIFMQGGVRNLNDPDQEMFLKSLSFLSGWPITLLQHHPKESRFHYFKRGTILAEDTRKYEWLIIVKSGSISILKKLKKVGPYEWKKKPGLTPLTEREKRERKEQKSQWRRFVLPELRLPLRKQKEIDEVEERVDGKPKPFKHPDPKVRLEKNDTKAQKIYYPNLWTFKQYTEGEDENKMESFSNINKQYLYLMSGGSANDKQNMQRMAKSANKVSGKPKKAQPSRPRPGSDTRSTESPALSDVSDVTLTSSLLRSKETENMMSSTNSLATTCSSLFDEYSRLSGGTGDTPELTDVDLNPQFVQIQTLVKGDVWGLANLLLDDQPPSFTVVSNGADCVLINKNFYYQHCSEKLLRTVRHEVCPYPTDDTLQENLQTSVDWTDYRQNELTNTMTTVRSARCLRDQVFSREGEEQTC